MYWLAQQEGFREARCVSVHTALGTTFGTSVPASLQQGDDEAPKVGLLIFFGPWAPPSARAVQGVCVPGGRPPAPRAGWGKGTRRPGWRLPTTRHPPSRHQVTYLPAPGWHLLRHRGRLFAIARRRASGNPQLAVNARWAAAAPPVGALARGGEGTT